MRKDQFCFFLPPELIAQEPCTPRSASRLLVVDGVRALRDCLFSDLPELLAPGDLLVVNDTRVFPARLMTTKPTGGRVEILLERVLGDDQAWVRARGRLRPGQVLMLPAGASLTLVERREELFLVRFSGPGTLMDFLEVYGQTPLPPYIRRPLHAGDRDRYQTVFSRETGAVAAPTAGLHFDESVLEALRRRGIETVALTLHVGGGTFQPLRTENIEDHRMHPEVCHVSVRCCNRIAATKAAGGRVIAVGTTVVRALETAARTGTLQPFSGSTALFIYPGFEFRVVDALVTNFHLPESTLLMLVCAFGGYETVMAAYRHAVAERYRFFSYGDAMLVWPSGRCP